MSFNESWTRAVVSEQAVAAILNGLSDAVFLIGDGRDVLLCNQPAEALFGNDLRGRDLSGPSGIQIA